MGPTGCQALFSTLSPNQPLNIHRSSLHNTLVLETHASAPPPPPPPPRETSSNTSRLHPCMRRAGSGTLKVRTAAHMNLAAPPITSQHVAHAEGTATCSTRATPCTRRAPATHKQGGQHTHTHTHTYRGRMHACAWQDEGSPAACTTSSQLTPPPPCNTLVRTAAATQHTAVLATSLSAVSRLCV
jgi:hypothetical protein